MRTVLMFEHRVRTSIVAVGMVVAVLAASVVATPSVTAHPTQRERNGAAAVVTETAKVTLPETSIAGPGFGGVNAGLVHQTSIAWTGTDAAHHLNVSSGTDGLTFPNKTTLSESSPNGPALAVGPEDTPPSFAVAWRGTDAHHLLNVQTGPDGTKLTLRETSIATPALVFAAPQNGGGLGLLLAWTGTDANHSLNVLPLTVVGVGGPTSLVPGTKTVLGQFSSNAGPSLAAVTNSDVHAVVLGWSTAATQQLNLAESTDAVHFSSALGSGLPETSATAPQLVQSSATNTCIAWTGTDAAHHLNVQCTTQFPQFPDPADTKTVLAERALGAPGFAGTSPADIAWTGTDAAHHLNVASLALP
jgi:hypothetical protein